MSNPEPPEDIFDEAARALANGLNVDALDQLRHRLGAAGIERFNRLGGVSIPRRRRADKVALVLTGGGAKGCFQAGAVRRLWNEQGLRPDIICGVSVGALNGAKLAEGTDTAADELREIWRDIALGRSRVWDRGKFLKEVGRVIADADIVQLIDFLLDPEAQFHRLPDDIRIALARLHSIHSFEPLRELIRDHLDVRRIRESGIALRIGMVDSGGMTGTYYSVSEPDADWSDGVLSTCGRLDPEPEHGWAGIAVETARKFVMRLADAIYVSSAMPVWMDAPLVSLASSILNAPSGEQLNLTEVAYPPSPTPPPQGSSIGRTIEERIGFPGGTQWFDGGLRDVAPLRTAMRLGARDIWVVTGSTWNTYNWQYQDPIGPLTNTPALQYVQSEVAIRGTDIARNNMLTAIALNELCGWLYRSLSHVPHEARASLLSDFNRYWEMRGPAVREALGASMFVGGYYPFAASEDPDGLTRDGEQPLGSVHAVPFHDEGCRIRLIAPSESFIGTTDFDNGDAILTGLELGFDAAGEPVDLSFPVPDDALEYIRLQL